MLKLRKAKTIHIFILFLCSVTLYGCGGQGSENAARPEARAMSPAPISIPTFNGPRSNYFITKTSTGYTVLDVVGLEGTRQIGMVDQIKFSDVTITLNMAEKIASISKADYQMLVELYIAFFNRLPDADGLSYWIEQRRNGMSVEEISNHFYDAAIAFSSLTGYSATMSNADFVNIIYKNVLGREGADQIGLDYWTNQLTSGQSTRGGLIRTILNAAHSFRGDLNYGWVANLLDNKFKVADDFANIGGVTFNTPEDAINKGKEILATVTPTDVSVAAKFVAERTSNTRTSVSANAGGDQQVELGAIVILNGTGSSKSVGSALSYSWKMTKKPLSSNVSLTASDVQSITFKPDVIGEYQFELTARQGDVTSFPSTIKVTVTERTVVASELVIGKAYKARNGLTIRLNAFDVVDKGNGYYAYTVNYTQTNETNIAIDEGTLKLYFGSEEPMPQFGAFNKVFPGPASAITRSYTFQQLKSSKPTILEYDHENFFAKTPIKNSLQWIVPAQQTLLGTIALSSSDFFGQKQLDFPFNSTNTFTVSVIGSNTATISSYTLTATGKDFTIANLEAKDATGTVIPYFNNLSNGQIIKAGTSVNFSLMLPLTKGKSVSLLYKFAVLETGQTFNVTATGMTN